MRYSTPLCLFFLFLLCSTTSVYSESVNVPPTTDLIAPSDNDIVIPPEHKIQDLKARGVFDNVKGWYNRQLVDRLVDAVRPVVESEIEIVIEKEKVDMLENVPSAIKGTLEEILGLKPIDTPKNTYGWFGPIYKFLFGKIDEIIVKTKTSLKNEINTILNDAKPLCVDGALRGIKKQFYWTRRLNRRGLLKWYRNKIETTVAKVMVEVRPEVHKSTVMVVNRYMNVLPKILKDVLDVFLPDYLKQNQNALVKRGLWDDVKKKIEEWKGMIVNMIKKEVEKVVVKVEDQIMVVIEKATKKRLSELLPFY
ncbi:hypothetical protein BKA69DRAFT_1078852 [Paraphysoderma sedebokerense]|nr:hypothetical protein BKA69DRAFT_1078852 [Paraphysoderma sedebokerense]